MSRRQTTTSPVRSRGARGAGFSMVDAMLAVVVVSLIVVGAMEAAGSATRSQLSLSTSATGNRLAEALVSEISARYYVTPSVTTGLLSTLTSSYDRSNYLGVDAYVGFTESPPRSRDGTQIADTTWTRSVALTYVQPTSPTTTSVTDTGLRRITVTVSRSGRTVSTRTTFKASD